MKKTIFILSLLFFAFSCDNSSKGSKTETDTGEKKDTMNSANDITITWQELHSGKDCAVQNPVNMVISSVNQFDSLWSTAFSGEGHPPKPVIDFTKNSVVALFLGTVKSGGHSVSITSLKMENDVIKIEGEHKLPGQSCISTTAIEFPFYIAKTEPALKGTPEFSIKKKEYECE